MSLLSSLIFLGLNLLTVYIYFTLSAASIGLLGKDLWLTGHELEPGVRVLDGMLSASAVRTVMDFPSDTGTSEGDLPDFQQLRAMNVLVQCTKKSAHVDHSTFGYLSPCTAQSKADFQDALHHTADILSSSLDAYDSLFCQSPVDASPLLKTPSPTRFSKRDPVQPHCPKQANQEMITAGLVQSSRLLHPFNQPDDMDDRDLPPTSVVELDPFSEEYHQKLRKELRLDTDEYSHVHPAVLNQFDTLLRKYPHAFLLPGAPLRRIHGTEHHINTENAPPCYKPPYRMSPSELQAVRDQITAMLKQDIIRPSKSPWGAPAILVRRKDLHGKPQPPRFVVDYRALNSVTKSDGFPLPQVIDILDWLGGGKSFAKLDLANGYWQVPVREEDREKTAVVTHCGLFEFISMPFGLKTAGATFQRLMQATFSGCRMSDVGCRISNGFRVPFGKSKSGFLIW